MQKRDVVMICASIVTGLAIHGWITRPSHVAEKTGQGAGSSNYTLNAKLMELQPFPISIGGETLVVVPLASVRGNSVESNPQFFKYEAGELRRVPVQ